MTYQVLYRAWRPNNFADLVGQEPIRRTLENALRQKRISHAYLFAGPRGTGKTSTARIMAMALNCAEPKDGQLVAIAKAVCLFKVAMLRCIGN